MLGRSEEDPTGRNPRHRGVDRKIREDPRAGESDSQVGKSSALDERHRFLSQERKPAWGEAARCAKVTGNQTHLS